MMQMVKSILTIEMSEDNYVQQNSCIYRGLQFHGSLSGCQVRLDLFICNPKDLFAEACNCFMKVSFNTSLFVLPAWKEQVFNFRMCVWTLLTKLLWPAGDFLMFLFFFWILLENRSCSKENLDLPQEHLLLFCPCLFSHAVYPLTWPQCMPISHLWILYFSFDHKIVYFSGYNCDYVENKLAWDKHGV